MIPKEKRSKKLQWYYDNQESQIQKNRKWKEDNREQMLEQKKEYHFKNRDSILIKKKEYRENNDAKIKQYRIDNKERDHKTQKEYRENNVEKEKIRHTKYSKENPDKMLKNSINALKKLGDAVDMTHFKVGMALKNWSQTIRKNDPNCAICDGIADVTHHIIHKQYYPQLMFNLNNGIPLCKSHHHEVHWGTV
jgi:hypothetical protein